MENHGVLRSRAKITEVEEGTNGNLEEKVKEIKIDQRPFIQFEGKIKYFTTLIDCAIRCDEMLNMANQASDLYVIGFDLEWPFSFKTGPGRTAVIQMSPTLDECYIFHVSTLKKLPKSLTELLAHDKVRLTGVNIKNDIKKLSRDFEGIDVEKAINNCIDANTLANSILNVQRRWSMEALVDKFFDMRVNKDKKVRNSKWDIMPLSEEQQQYAAIDAYVSLKLFHHLKEMEIEITAKENNANYDNI